MAYVAPPYGVDVSANWRNIRHPGARRPDVADFNRYSQPYMQHYMQHCTSRRLPNSR